MAHSEEIEAAEKIAMKALDIQGRISLYEVKQIYHPWSDVI